MKNKFLQFLMFKDEKKVKHTSRIIQFNFPDDNESNCLDSTGIILNNISKEIKKYLPNNISIKPTVAYNNVFPFTTIKMENITSFSQYTGFLDGFKMNNSLLWNKWKSDTSPSLIIDFNEPLLTLAKVNNLVRIGFLNQYETTIDNLLENNFFKSNNNFKPIESAFQIEYKDYDIKFAIQENDKDKIDILWDVAYNKKIISVKDFRKFITNMIKDKEIEIFDFLNKQEK